jgi:hypothetical protein
VADLRLPKGEPVLHKGRAGYTVAASKPRDGKVVLIDPAGAYKVVAADEVTVDQGDAELVARRLLRRTFDIELDAELRTAFLRAVRNVFTADELAVVAARLRQQG